MPFPLLLMPLQSTLCGTYFAANTILSLILCKNYHSIMSLAPEEQRTEKRRKTNEDSDDEDWNDQLRRIWKNADSTETAFNETVALIGKQMDALIRNGLDAFHRWENTSRELQLLKEECKGQQVEFDRLRTAEEKSRATMSNLLSALESSRTKARETSRAAVSEASLRADLSVCISQRDEATAMVEEAKRKATLFQEELRSTKTKLARVTQEKLKMERDQRATLSLAKSLDHQSSSAGSAEYYKRKVSDLSSQVQSLHAVVAEKNRQLDETRRQMERNMSQNRLAQLRTNRKLIHD